MDRILATTVVSVISALIFFATRFYASRKELWKLRDANLVRVLGILPKDVRYD